MKKRVLSVMLALSMALALLPGTAWAVSSDFQIENGELKKYVGSETDVEIPDTVTKIGSSAFQNNQSLTKVSIPSSVKEIGYNAFNACTSLTEVSIENGLTEIGLCSFDGCTSLTSITIPESVTHIGSRAFRGCTSLKQVTFPSGEITIDTSAFQNTPWQKDFGDFVIVNGTLLVYQGTDATVTVPSGVHKIASNAFGEPVSSVVLPEGVTKIDDYAFANCSTLKSITLPDTLTEIGQFSFSCCFNLTSITIPAGVTTIGDYAFYMCETLSSAEIMNDNVQIGSRGAFHTGKEGVVDGPIQGLIIYGPQSGGVQAYCQKNGIPFQPLGSNHPSANENEAARRFVNEALKYVNYTGRQFADAMNDALKPETKIVLPDQWCAAFVSYCAKAANVDDVIPYNVGAGYIMKSVMNAGGQGVRFDSAFNGTYMNKATLLESRNDYTPQLGDLVAFRNTAYATGVSHVGIVCGVDDDYVYVVHGNWGHNGKHQVCAPAGYASKNCIYISSSSLGPGGPCGKFPRNGTANQNMRIVGYVRPNWPGTGSQKSGTVDVVAKCPIEISVAYGGEVLSSAANALSTSFGTMIVDNASGERSISFHLNGYYDVDTLITGTGSGEMELTVTHTENSTETKYVFRNVPITQDSTIQVIDPNNTSAGISLLISNDDETTVQKVWYADGNETATSPDDELTEWYSGTNYSFTTPDSSNPGTSNPGGGSSSSGSSKNPGETAANSMNTITVPSVTGGKVSVNPSSAKAGQSVTVMATSDPGYELISLTVTDTDGKNVALSNAGDGQNTFVMPNGNVTVDAVFSKAWSNPFTDASQGAWYYDAVKFVHQNGLMYGVGNGLFAPETHLSRAMLAEILYNKEGRPVISDSTAAFPDVSENKWYAGTISWAYGRGVIKGYDNGRFGPDDDITREQLAVMLYRYAGSPVSSNSQLNFTDAHKVSSWAQDAVRWAADQGILNGKGNGVLDPAGKATRAEAAQMLQNYLAQ